MGKALIRFYEELNDYLPPDKRKRDFEVLLNGKTTVLEILEKRGVPPAQVDLLLLNGESVALDEVVRTGDRISVYPVFERLNIKGVSRVRDQPLRKLAFLVDRDLKPLAQSLHRRGLDVRFRDDFRRGQPLRPLREERRILLTLRGDLPTSKQIDRMIVLKPGSLHEQVDQVIEALDLEL
jgi:hypothetical protein